MSDQWQPGSGEIPDRPRDAFMQQAPASAPHFPYQAQPSAEIHTYTAATSTPSQNGHTRKTLEEIRQMRRQEREAGVDFWLEKTGIMARVRDLPFTDRIMLMGIPADMHTPIERALELAAQVTETTGIASSLQLIEGMATVDDGICIAGFLWPRLFRDESERLNYIAANGLAPEDALLVDDLHPDEKTAYRERVFRDRHGEREDTARLASFPGAGMAEAPGGQDRPSEASSTFTGSADGGVGLRPRDAAFAG